MGHKTPLYDTHIAAGARVVDFGGWDMPLHYGSQKEEHLAVRRHAGMFDVSHMTVVDLHGPDSQAFLRRLLANDVARLTSEGRALYSCMLNEQGGVIDDLIVYWLGDDWYRLIVNAATREKDLAWIKAQARDVDVTVSERDELAMLAVQGPEARSLAAGCLPAEHRDSALALRPFHGHPFGELFVARTGYTGEDGWEILGTGADIEKLWHCLADAGVAPAGLGARDTLRLEAAMNLYGNDMNEDVSPLTAGLEWTVAWEPGDRAFTGREALEAEKAGQTPRFVGLLLEGRGVLRSHQRVVVEGIGEGEITSGGFSPSIGRSIALARLPAGDYQEANVEIRGKLQPVRLVKTPFVRNGTIKIDLERPTGEQK